MQLYVAASVTSARRLRQANRVAPGRVRALGDARDDVLVAQAAKADAKELAAVEKIRARIEEQSKKTAAGKAEAYQVTIPNTTVKPCTADGTILATVWKNRRLPDL